MAGLVLKDVAKRYASASVIEGLNLEIRDQEFMVLVGPSGCGKSTALRMIAGLESISGGTISMDGRVLNDVPAKDRDVAMVFQSYALYPHMTVRQNLEFGLKIRKTPREEIDRLVAEAAKILGLDTMLERRPRDLSGGQRQRVALGRAIVRKPAAFLFDEPLSNLDAKLRVFMRAQIKKLQSDLKTTAVYVTHDQVEAMTMGHRIAVMNAGKLQQVGTPLEVYERPANVFVAGFIGTPPMNLIPGAIGADAATVVVSGLTFTVPEAMRAQTAGKGGLKIIAGIRPENLYGPGKPPPPGAVVVEATAEVLETLGHEVIVHGRVADDVFVFIVDPRSAPELGSKVTVHFDPAFVHLFDAATEQRL
jgi:multiple sugar transport system ATP-binding protein